MTQYEKMKKEANDWADMLENMEWEEMCDYFYDLYDRLDIEYTCDKNGNLINACLLLPLIRLNTKDGVITWFGEDEKRQFKEGHYILDDDVRYQISEYWETEFNAAKARSII